MWQNIISPTPLKILVQNSRILYNMVLVCAPPLLFWQGSEIWTILKSSLTLSSPITRILLLKSFDSSQVTNDFNKEVNDLNKSYLMHRPHFIFLVICIVILVEWDVTLVKWSGILEKVIRFGLKTNNIKKIKNQIRSEKCCRQSIQNLAFWMLHKNILMRDIKHSFEDVNIYELIELHYRIRNRSKNKFRKLYTACTVLYS